MNDDLKIKASTSAALKVKALTKVKMLVRKMNAGTATDDDLGEAVELMRIIGVKVKPGTPAYAAMMRLKDTVEQKLREQRQDERETPPDKPTYLH